MTKMRAVIFYGPKEIRLEEVPLPKPKPGEVLIKIGAALTCGTDFKAYRQGHKVLLGDYPAPFGHELAGTVVASGEGAEGFTPGMRVVAANSAPCDDCFYCKRRQSQLCENLKLHNGAYAEFNLVPAHIVRHNLYPLPDDLEFHTAALAEPLACAIHGVDVMNVQAGETVAILGAGNMALLLIQALVDRGANIIAIGRNPERLKIAMAAGAHQTISILEGDAAGKEHDLSRGAVRESAHGATKAVRAMTNGLGADVVFEAVGKADTWRDAMGMVRKGGRVCLFGGCASGTQVPVDAHRVHYEQLQLQGVFHHTPKYFSEALGLLSRGGAKPELLISSRIKLEEVPEFFERMHNTASPKVAVIP
ncbi:MAG: zinc-binding dehydrogenase [Proteobacteria bacterium]|nr:zinc-binding dehydrogenase [Pseudomonadota bacterium]